MGGDCRKQGVSYSIICITCQEERKTRSVVSAYEAETGRNAYERGKEHLAALQKKSEDSVMWLHSCTHHRGREGFSFIKKVKRACREPLDRKLGEKVNICGFKGDILMNRKTELRGAVEERESYKYRRWGVGRPRERDIISNPNVWKYSKEINYLMFRYSVSNTLLNRKRNKQQYMKY